MTGFEPAASWSRSQRSDSPQASKTSQNTLKRQAAALGGVQPSHPGPANTRTFVTHLLPEPQGPGPVEAVARLLTVAQVAAWLKVSTAMVYSLCARGSLPHSRLNNAIRIAPAAVEAYVQTQGVPYSSDQEEGHGQF